MYPNTALIIEAIEKPAIMASAFNPYNANASATASLDA